MQNEQPLILVANDDGILSPGLWAAAQALLDLGEPLVVAPCQQWSGAGRSFPINSPGTVSSHPLEIAGRTLDAFCVDASPAQVVLRAVLELAPRKPDLLVVGINYGENMGADVTISGTVGAALQGAAQDIPSLAVSLQTPKETHGNPSTDIDFTTAIHFTRFFARRLLAASMPFDVDVLKIDIPSTATPTTPWRLTRVSRQTYFRAIPPNRQGDDSLRPIVVDYEARWDQATIEPDSDIYALGVERIVSVAPLSLDLSSRTDLGEVEALLHGHTEL
jgi:5'-nucleotidase